MSLDQGTTDDAVAPSGHPGTENPFVPGTRVAVSSRWDEDITEGFVEKVYKSGNFTLRGSKQQWRSWQQHNYGEGPGRWSAIQTGGGYTRRRLDLWDETTDTEIREKIEARQTKQRWRNIRAKIDNMREPTAAMCAALEAALTVSDDRSAVDAQSEAR
jgi:hypothetical protein